MESAQRHMVRFQGSSGEAAVRCFAGQSLLAALAEQRAPIRVGCRGGGCGVCEVRILAGQARYGRMSERHVGHGKRLRGYALACQTYPTTDLIIELIDTETQTED